jgi:methyltransferase
MPPLWYVALLAGIGASRLQELRISRANERIRGGDRASERNFPLIVGLHVALLTLPLVEVARNPRTHPRWGWLGVLAAATALKAWSIRSLGDAWNVHASVPRHLEPITRGPYRYIRHPNYVALILEFLAVPLVAGAWMSAVVLSALNAAVLYDRITAEERLLERSAAYRQAFARRARFVPGVF